MTKLRIVFGKWHLKFCFYMIDRDREGARPLKQIDVIFQCRWAWAKILQLAKVTDSLLSLLLLNHWKCGLRFLFLPKYTSNRPLRDILLEHWTSTLRDVLHSNNVFVWSVEFTILRKFLHLIELEISMNLFILFILADFKVDNEILRSKTAIAQSWVVYQIVILQG